MLFRSLVCVSCLGLAVACNRATPTTDAAPVGRAADLDPRAIGRPAPAAAAPAAADAAPLPDGPQTVKVQVTGKGYTPSEIRARAGRELTLEVTRTEPTECGKVIVIPSEKIERELPVGTPVVITFTPKASGTVGFACGMDMMKGSIIVSDPS